MICQKTAKSGNEYAFKLNDLISCFSSCSSSCNKEYIMNGRYDIFEKRKKLYDEKIYILCSRLKYWGKLCLKPGGLRIRCKKYCEMVTLHLFFWFWANNSAYKIEDYVLFAQDKYENYFVNIRLNDKKNRHGIK